MADNTQLFAGSGGDVIKTEDVGAYKLAVSKIYLGAHGVDGGAVTASNPFPVSVVNFPATQAVAGSVAVTNFPATQSISASSLPLPSGAATAAKQAAPGAAGVASADVLSVQGIAAMTPLKVDGSAVTQPVSGSVNIGNFPATQAISGTVAVGGTAATDVVDRAARQLGSATVSGTVGLAAGSQTIGVAISGLQTGAIYSGTTGLTPKFAPIAASSVGDNTVVAGVSGKKLRVLKYTIVTSAAVAARFRTSSGADLTGAMLLAANSGVGGAFCPVGLFETAAGDGLVLNLTGGVAVAGHLTYIEI